MFLSFILSLCGHQASYFLSNIKGSGRLWVSLCVFKDRLAWQAPTLQKAPGREMLRQEQKWEVSTTNYQGFLVFKWMLRHCLFLGTLCSTWMHVPKMAAHAYLWNFKNKGSAHGFLYQPICQSPTPTPTTHFGLFFFFFFLTLLPLFRTCLSFILKGSVCHPSCDVQSSVLGSTQHLIPSWHYTVLYSMSKSICALVNVADDLLWVEKL